MLWAVNTHFAGPEKPAAASRTRSVIAATVIRSTSSVGLAVARAARVERRSAETKRYVFYFFMGLAAVISLITVVIAQLSWRGWVSGMRSLLRGEGLLRDPGQGGNAPEFRPIARDLQRLIRELETELEVTRRTNELLKAQSDPKGGGRSSHKS